MSTRFTVTKTYDLPAREGLLVTGHVTEGDIGPNTTLREQTTGRQVRILSVEFLTPAAIRENRTTLVVDRRDAAAVEAGSVLVDAG